MSDNDFKNYAKNNELQFKDIEDSVNKINAFLQKIDERHQKHYVDFISSQKDVEYLQKENIEMKDYFNKKIKHIWDEVRINKKELQENIKDKNRQFWFRLSVFTPFLLGITSIITVYITRN